MRATLRERKEIAKDTLYLVFDLLGHNLLFQPGQFFRLTLLNPPYSDNRGSQRLFGFLNSTTESWVVETATIKGVSAFKKSLAEIPLGTEVDIGSVGGEDLLTYNNAKPLVFIASGIGIAPFMSLTRSMKALSLPDTIMLIYEQTDKASAAFLDELTAYSKENPNFTLIVTITEDPTWEGEKRTIDDHFIKEHIPHPDMYHYVITGPVKNVLQIQEALKLAGAKPEDVRIEVFAGY